MQITLTSSPKPKPTSTPKFGALFTDHMFVMEYSEKDGWHNQRIQPYQSFQLDPATSLLHYGQGLFEGLKAFKNAKGEINVFRPQENFKRLNSSCGRLVIPPVDEKAALEYLTQLIKIDKEWVPDKDGESLYIRPVVFACEHTLGVHPAKNFIFYIIMSPVGSYYGEKIVPVKLYAEDKYVRACKGGTGHYKVIGNYAASLKAAEEAEKRGYEQVLWLDAETHSYVEEVGSMNIFFVKNNEIITPALEGSILPGITRKSLIELMRHRGYKVTERKISLNEVLEGLTTGEVTECFGSGTAAVVSPVGLIGYKGKDYVFNHDEIGPVSKEAYDALTSIQKGKSPDIFNWLYKVE